ncbi:MAG: glycoside hydrolase family 3 C-terminal domain-containing protein [Ignavibacteriales bacterium]|nr:glycoside hydrolase family 3 C-terminal domain-containing protein [Ignavibacteriales bacterium]
MLRELVEIGKPVVLVLLNGSSLAVNWAADNVPAIIEAWYPGQAAGDALADVLFGDYNPSGRLPVTFYRSVEQIPPFKDYSMKERTYRYFTGDPLYPFGYGLSYTKFKYSNLKIPDKIDAGGKVKVSVEVQNIGKVAGDEVVQLYARDVDASATVPIHSLQGFKRVHLKPRERKNIEFILEPRQLSLIDNQNERIVEPGTFEICIGGKQPGFSGTSDSSTTGYLKGQFEVVGEPLPIKESR